MRAALGVLALVTACASALHEPPPLSALAPGHGQGRSADELVAEANVAWARRAEPGYAEKAQDLFLDAATADPHRSDVLLGAMKALAFRIEHEDGATRGALAEKEVQLGQWCLRRAPADPECSYRLAIALGQQARERNSTGHDALDKMVALLHQAIAANPKLDDGGPHRVLALVLLRAPSWPVGPGDKEAALDEARAAADLAPNEAENQLVLGEALAANGQKDAARAAFARALALANQARASGDPEAPSWVAQARKGMSQG